MGELKRAQLPVIIISRGLDGVLETPFSLARIGSFLNRDLVVQIESGLGIAFHRTAGVRRLANMGKVIRGIMIDADIRIPLMMSGHFADAIREADERNLNIVAPVKLITGFYNVARTKDDKDGITQDQLNELPDWRRIYAGGLAFYYGAIHTDYRFHEGDSEYGEDWNYILDNKIPLNVCKLPVQHYKDTLL